MILAMMNSSMKLKSSLLKLEVVTLGPQPLVAIQTMTLGGPPLDGPMGGTHGDGHHGIMGLTPGSQLMWTFSLT